MENTKFFDILRSSNIEGYYRYVNDTLLVYNKNNTDVEEVHDIFNNVTTYLKITLGKKKKTKS
jgi:hypothetical protein